MDIYFKEEQKFKQWWLWLLLTLSAITSIILVYQQLFSKNNFIKHNLDESQVLIFCAVIIFTIILFSILKLTTTINQSGIYIKYFPFINKEIAWNDIKSAEVIKYNFVGGWGIRLLTKYGTVYNVKGNKGLAIELKNGKKLLIGTQKEEELKNIITKSKKD